MVEIRKVECPKNRISVKCPYEMKPTRIVIHNTDNDAPAKNEVSYMHRNGNTVSFHFAVDDKEIVQGIALNRNAFHAGDGGNGKGNREGIAIEICYSKSGGKRFETAQKNAAELTAKLLKDYGWGIDRVTKHQDYNGKNCPKRTLEDYGWEYFLNLVKGYMNETPAKETVSKNTAATIKEGDKVKVKKGAKSYEGKSVASFVYENEYKVDDISGNRAVLDKNGICTAFNVKDLTKVGATKTPTKKAYTGTFPKLPEIGYLQKGDEGTQVRNLQKFLNWCISAGLNVDGDFGAKTDKAVREYQKQYGLKEDGLFGKKSLEKAKTIKK